MKTEAIKDFLNSMSDTAREYYDRHTTLTEDNISELYDIFTK